MIMVKETIVRMYEGKRYESEFIAGIGNLTADVNTRTVEVNGEKRIVTDGRSSIAFNIFVDGERVPVFYQIDAWDKTAENLAKFAKKGRQLFVSGKVKQEEYETKEGEKRTSNVLKLEKFQFLDYVDINEVKDKPEIEGFEPTEDEDLPF